ncbi:MAG: polyamine ABC transporter substrate-binding protein [Mesorhizobium sp.]|uniref:ABC transporter substrate-binding protein n=1 Tax=Mesorhizobium sp. TaxID=1871066 RepID=UPI001224F958|nr:ABC transporter substrate-binding protein [Mesorhizobium sp.]TIQ37066.1 MAG: polyamine ABC transporter substrate-binding protein [Mesorhizobium sp.]
MKLKTALFSSLLVLSSATLMATSALAEPSTNLNLGSLGADVSQLDPDYAANTTDRTVVAWIFNALVRFQPGSTDPSTIEPDLAESWQSSPDKLVWTFHLRHGVKWQKGYGEMTADDVVYSLKKASDKNTSAYAPDYAAVKSIEAVDPYTVKITLDHQIPSLLGLVANYSGGFIMPKKAVEEKGANFTRDPVGSGPFQVDKISPGQSITFKANEDYFRGAPQIKTVTLRFLPESASRDLAFRSGEIDAAAGVQNKNWLNRMKAEPNIKLDVFAPAEEAQLHLNVTKAPLDKLEVRQALSLAINQDQMVQFQGEDFTQPGQSAVPSNNLGFTKDSGVLGYDPEKAKALLKQAGLPEGFTIPMINSQDTQLANLGQLVQAQLAAIGVKVDIKPVEHATYHQLIRKDASPMVIYSAARFPVADVYLTQFFYGPSAIGQPTAVTNFSHCDVADAEIKAAKTETDSNKQVKLWQEAQKKLMTNVCSIPLVETRLIWVRKDSLDWGYDLKGSMSLGPLLTEKTRFTN